MFLCNFAAPSVATAAVLQSWELFR